jgi:branched-subunit amino acid transport protein AzlD
MMMPALSASPGYLWLAVAVMSVITIALRALPLLIRRSVFTRPWMLRLNRGLPLCVMAVLVAHSLAGGGAPLAALWPKLLAQTLALLTVAVSYWRWRHALLSVVVGLAALALIERVMALA